MEREREGKVEKERTIQKRRKQMREAGDGKTEAEHLANALESPVRRGSGASQGPRRPGLGAPSQSVHCRLFFLFIP